jgi:hypothetical protein
MSNKQQTAVELFVRNLETQDGTYRGFSNIRTTHEKLINQAKEMEKERMIKLIQFVVSEKELVDYSSVSNYTANYYLDKFNQGGNK